MEDINFDLYWSQQLDAHLEDDYYFEIDEDYEFERLNDR